MKKFIIYARGMHQKVKGLLPPVYFQIKIWPDLIARYKGLRVENIFFDYIDRQETRHKSFYNMCDYIKKHPEIDYICVYSKRIFKDYEYEIELLQELGVKILYFTNKNWIAKEPIIAGAKYAKLILECDKMLSKL